MPSPGEAGKGHLQATDGVPGTGEAQGRDWANLGPKMIGAFQGLRRGSQKKAAEGGLDGGWEKQGDRKIPGSPRDLGRGGRKVHEGARENTEAEQPQRPTGFSRKEALKPSR